MAMFDAASTLRMRTLLRTPSCVTNRKHFHRYIYVPEPLRGQGPRVRWWASIGPMRASGRARLSRWAWPRDIAGPARVCTCRAGACVEPTIKVYSRTGLPRILAIQRDRTALINANADGILRILNTRLAYLVASADMCGAY